MSGITIIWSMISSACLTLAAIYFLVWGRNRAAWSHLLFAITAMATAGLAFCELWMMRTQSVGDLNTALRAGQVALLILLVSLTWFVRTYLGAGRTWLAVTISIMRVLYVLPNFLIGWKPGLPEIALLRRIVFLGESATVARGVPNRFLVIGQLSTLLILVFAADAGVTAWRRGDRRKALVVTGSIEFFIVTGLLTSLLVVWGNIQMPIMISFCYLALVAVMAYELSRDVIRASQLVQQLQISESRLQGLSGRLLSAQEEERRRIARELHDSLSQQMALLVIEIDQVAAQPGHSPALVMAVRQLGERSAEIATELHSLSHRLHSAKLDALGLVAALRGHCQEVLSHGVKVHFSEESVPGRVPAEVELCLFRVVQEGLNNVVKHSGAREAIVTLTGTADALAVRIADLGRGFDLAAAADRDGLGLASMRERLRLVGGELSIRSMSGRGTIIDASAPLRL